MLIAYYVSDYGYGHASRSVATIRSILKSNSNIRFIICCSFPLDFIKKSLEKEGEGRVAYRYVTNDIGYVLKDDSIEPDIIKLQQKYEFFLAEANSLLHSEINFLINAQIDIIISDIAPIPFLAAKAANVYSIGISNFTWYSAYKGLISENKLSFLKEAYSKMDYFIALAGSNEPNWTENSSEIGFFSREIDQMKVSEIKSEIGYNDSKLVVYFGLGMRVGIEDIGQLKVWNSESCKFIISNNVQLKTNGDIHRIPMDETETQNYIAASDLVISKPGWGTISEAVMAKKPLLVIGRSGLNEDQSTIQLIRDQNMADVMSWNDFIEFKITQDLKSKVKDIIAVNQIASAQHGLQSLTKLIIDLTNRA